MTKTYMKGFIRTLSIGSLVFILTIGLIFPVDFTSADENLCAVDADVVLLLDVSGSMGDFSPSRCQWQQLDLVGPSYQCVPYGQDGLTEAECLEKPTSIQCGPPVYSPANPAKIDSAKNAAESFIDELMLEDQSALVTFSDTTHLVKSLSADHAATKVAVDGVVTGGSTNIGGAIEEAILELGSASGNPQATKTIILLTDGKANRPHGSGDGEDPTDVTYAEQKATEAASLGYKIFTIGLGSGSEINEAMLQNIANITGAQYHSAPDGSFLADIYQEISLEMCQYGSISGCKYMDLNNNLTIDTTDTPLPDWEIVLSGSASATQATDVNGCYTFAGLLAGDYTVSEGLNSGKQPYIRTYPVEESYNVSLSNSENITEKNFANYFPLCGNIFLDSVQGEQCDDGNLVDGDGCSSTCQVESTPSPTADPPAGTYTSAQNVILTASGASSIYYTTDGTDPTCSTGTVYSGTIPVPESLTIKAIACYGINYSAVATFPYVINTGGGGSVCGNSLVETGEQCDDGNTVDSDGCSSTCQIEPGSGILSGQIIINEIMQNPAAVSDANGEWFELYNTTQSDINLLNCIIGDGGGDAHIIHSSFIVPANGMRFYQKMAIQPKTGE
ncbi:MAG: VWA domain-containing protein [Candidatus Staskawiczbacteria bacterium]